MGVTNKYVAFKNTNKNILGKLNYFCKILSTKKNNNKLEQRNSWNFINTVYFNKTVLKSIWKISKMLNLNKILMFFSFRKITLEQYLFTEDLKLKKQYVTCS